MYNIETKNFGVKLTFSGFIQADEMNNWVEDSKKVLPSLGTNFGVFVDLRDLKPLPVDAQAAMEEGQKMYKQAGMLRSVVVLANPITTMQFKRIAKETGIYEWERYIDASAVSNWEQLAQDWIVSGKDPDAK
ncbi:MAG: hypothetical protein JXQ90_16110 [Cyclobacteriaceae bacterium]